MGLSAAEPLHARHRHVPRGGHDPGNAPSHHQRRRDRSRLRHLIAACLACFLSSQCPAETIRIASYSPDLSRRGPGLLLRDILKGDDEQISAAVAIVAEVDPDILLLTGFDFDAGQAALTAFAEALSKAGAPYPHRFSLRPNTGMATDLDLDGNGRTGEPRDAQGYGRFAGQAGMALLSRFPVETEAVLDLSATLWTELPGATLPQIGGKAFPSQEAQAIQRLSTTGHWVVPVRWPGRQALSLLAFYATPPVFDGPEDRNGLRNADELGLWKALLDGSLDVPAPDPPFVILGNANLDAADGDGRRSVMDRLLDDPRLQDSRPTSGGGPAFADPEHSGDPALDTVEWRPVAEGGPGNLRVDYVLPSADLEIEGSGVYWPSAGESLTLARNASRHRLVWLDLVVDR